MSQIAHLWLSTFAIVLAAVFTLVIGSKLGSMYERFLKRTITKHVVVGSFRWKLIGTLTGLIALFALSGIPAIILCSHGGRLVAATFVLLVIVLMSSLWACFSLRFARPAVVADPDDIGDDQGPGRPPL
ncbi:MAG TPA: hypothetical protein V6C81_11305 [Planktothrix sp.]|jgi:hypothetical protein